MKKVKLMIMAVAVLCLSSCGMYTSSSPFSVGTKLEMSMSDLVFLGESEISVEYDTYLGFIRSIQKVNGEIYNPGNQETLSIPTGAAFNVDLKGKAMKLAAAKLLKEYPEGRYFQQVIETSKTDVLFLGSTTKKTAKIRVYKFK